MRWSSKQSALKMVASKEVTPYLMKLLIWSNVVLSVMLYDESWRVSTMPSGDKVSMH